MIKLSAYAIKTLPLLLVPYLLSADTHVTLEEIHVVEEKESKTNTIAIDLGQEEQHQASTLFDLFKNNASTELGGGSMNTQRIYVRGLESSTLNVSLDGAKQGKNMFQHFGNELGVNPDLLKTIDVQTRPDASYLGALGGAIVMITKDAQDFTTDAKKTGAIINGGYGSNARTLQGGAIAYGVADYWGIYTNISGVNSSDYKNGNNDKVYATGYHDRDYLIKLSMLNYEDHTLRFTLSENENKGNYQWKGADMPMVSVPREPISSITDTYAFQHIYHPNDLINLNTQANASILNLKREKYDIEYENETLSLKTQNRFSFETGAVKNRLDVGVELVNETGEDKTSALSYDAYTKDRALFFQNDMSFEQWTLYYGGRVDDYTFHSGFGTITDVTFSPNIGLNYALTDSSDIYANYVKSSRMTGTIPLTWMTNVTANATYKTDLKPETSTRYEIGYTQRLNNTFLENDRLNLTFNVFKTRLEDLIVSEGGEGGVALKDIYNNPNDFESKGFEIKTVWSYDNYTTSLSYTQIDANSVNDDSNALPTIDEGILLRRVGTYDMKKVVWNSKVDFTKTLSADYTLSAVGGINDPIVRGGYTTHDVSMRWKPSVKSPWTYFLAVNNLTDKNYAKHSTIAAKTDASLYREEPGRDIRLSFKYEF